jgi:hypothetical protein
MAADSEGRGGEDVNRERRYSIRSDRECRAEGCQHRSPAGAEEDDKRKLYALHAPEVEYIGKGKADASAGNAIRCSLTGFTADRPPKQLDSQARLNRLGSLIGWDGGDTGGASFSSAVGTCRYSDLG